MNKEEAEKLKSKIYSQIEQLNNEAALEMLQEAVTAYSTPQNDIVDELTNEQKQRLQDSVQQANDGKTFSNEEVKQKSREWLSK